MSNRHSVIVGLSGGVDSAVCAALLMRAGYTVRGVFLSQNGTSPEDAMAVAKGLGIELDIVDITSFLYSYVSSPFTEAYLNGYTPNPCVICNPTVKFPALLEAARAGAVKYIATGHYANTELRGERYALSRGRRENDQSYMLYRLTQEQLSRVIFPLGQYTKDEVRDLALDFSLPVAKKPASMEICFIPDNNYAAYIESAGRTPPPGDFIDEAGNTLGRHNGIHHYTVGQRRGLGISAGKRVFVSKINPLENTVTLSAGEIYRRTVTLRDAHWTSIPETLPLRASVKVRHSKHETPGLITAGQASGELVIDFDEDVRAPAPGQSAVFYDGECVLGGGIIV